VNNTANIKVDGVNIRYLKVGRGEPLFLIHTMRTQLDYFQKVIPELSKHFEVYALDLPGHGYSDIPKAEFTMDFLAGSVGRILEKFQLHNVTLVGESIGGVIALSLASRDTASFKRIIAINPYDYGKGGGIRRSSLLAYVLLAAIQWPIVSWVVAHAEPPVLRKILEGGFQNKKALPEELVKEFNQVGFRKGYRRAEISLFRNWESWIRARDEYTKIQVPVTLVYGDRDWSRVEEREENHRRISDSKLVTLKETGHFSSLDAPEKVIEVILENSQVKIPTENEESCGI